MDLYSLLKLNKIKTEIIVLGGKNFLKEYQVVSMGHSLIRTVASALLTQLNT